MNIYKLLYIIILISFCLSKELLAQKDYYSWEGSANIGYMIPNNASYSDFSSLSFGVEAVWWNNSVDTSLRHTSRIPMPYGIKLSYAHLPNSVAGDRFGLVSMLREPLLGSKHWQWTLGAGISAYTRPRSLVDDSSNIFIGSLINCLLDVGLTYRSSDRFFFSFHFLHSSNGMLYRPNMGVNFLQFDVGYTFVPLREKRIPFRNMIRRPHYLRDTGLEEVSVAFSPGTVMPRDKDLGGYFFCYDLSLYYQRYTSPHFAFGGGIDFWYNGVDRELLAREKNYYTFPLYVSAMGVMEFFRGPISFKLGVGPVIVASNQVTTLFYERAGAYYNWGSNYLGVGINAHGGRIEFIEWTFGHRFRLN
jgi:hypothetical protein